jgi:hypothetical protein
MILLKEVVLRVLLIEVPPPVSAFVTMAQVEQSRVDVLHPVPWTVPQTPWPALTARAVLCHVPPAGQQSQL